MKKLALLCTIIFIVIACKKEQESLIPSIDFKFGHLSENVQGVHIEYYGNQDSISLKEIDTALAVSVVEFDLDDLKINPNILEDMENLEFIIYVNTSQDFEIFDTKNVYSIGNGGGANRSGSVASIDYHFVLPIRRTNVIQNDGKIEISNGTNYIRVSYESKYSYLSKVKTLRLTTN